MGGPEKVGRYCGPGYRKHLKRVLSKLRRRKAKHDPENAPCKTRHLTKGWGD